MKNDVKLKNKCTAIQLKKGLKYTLFFMTHASLISDIKESHVLVH